MLASKLTVLFENPFWIGIFEVEDGQEYKVSKVTFGAEPKDSQLYDFILKNYYKISFAKSKLEKDEAVQKKKENPKRLQRKIRKELEEQAIGTKAQNIIKAQYEENKIERKKKSKAAKEERERVLYEIKQAKRKEKHKGH